MKFPSISDKLGLLVSSSYASKKPVVVNKAMIHPLAPVSLPSCTAGGVNS